MGRVGEQAHTAQTKVALRRAAGATHPSRNCEVRHP